MMSRLRYSLWKCFLLILRNIPIACVVKGFLYFSECGVPFIILTLAGLVILPAFTTLVEGLLDLTRPRFLGFSKTGLLVPPGHRLRKFAEFFFSRKTYNEVFEPTLRDLYDEYCEALKENRLWKARWVCVRGYYSFWAAVFAQLPISAVKMVYKIWQATR